MSLKMEEERRREGRKRGGEREGRIMTSSSLKVKTALRGFFGRKRVKVFQKGPNLSLSLAYLIHY